MYNILFLVNVNLTILNLLCTLPVDGFPVINYKIFSVGYNASII